MKQLISILILGFLFLSFASAQTGERKEKITLDGEIVTALITEDNDTILIADLEDVSISMPRQFANNDERRRYIKYRRYANVVYPYAGEAIKVFRELEYVTETMKPRERKKHIKRLQKQYKKEFKDPLKNLTKLQGKILIKMIEKELETPFYDLLKGLRGGMTASYWNSFGRLFGYRLKDGYIKGEDHLLDAVLHDFNVSYEMPSN